jgi:hypothetical protein
MNARIRFLGLTASTLVLVSACNSILGITDLADPGVSDGGGGGPADAPGGGEAATDGRVPDATPDAPMVPCGLPGESDPCTLVDPQTDGGVFPTWPITSDLNIEDLSGSIATPMKPAYVPADGGGLMEVHSHLIWQTSYAAAGAGLDLPSALAACIALGTGWRLPTRIELATTQYRSHPLTVDSGPTTSCAPPQFDQSQLYDVWTSTAVPSAVPDPDENYFIADEKGCGFAAFPKATVAFKARCVKADVQPATFTVTKSGALVPDGGSVRAEDTKLEWERTGVVVQTVAAARAHCNQLGWRLPVIQEAYGIIDTRTTALFDPKLFAATPAGARILLSQTVLSLDPADGGTPSYEAIGLVSPPIATEDSTGPEEQFADLLVRCVRGPR